MPGRQDDDLAWRADRGGSTAAATPPSRSLPLGTAVALAVVATLVAVLTGDPALLRACVVVAAWAGVGAAYVAVRQLAERRAAAAREEELRRAYDRELDLADADRREHELRLENDVRRQADEALHAELGSLRAQAAELTRLREQLARVSGLGDSLAGLARLREDVAALGALRGDVAALSRLHEDVGQLGDLRDELAALRAELTDKIDAEMLVERILLRTRGFRTSERAAAAEEPAAPAPDALTWTEEPPRELTGGWPAVRLDQPPATREYETVTRERSWEPAVAPEPVAVPEPVAERRYGDPGWDPLSDPLPEPLAEATARWDEPVRAASRHDEPASAFDAPRYEDERYDPHAWRAGLADEPGADASAPTPLEWLADHSLLHPLDQPWTTPTQAVPVATPAVRPWVAPDGPTTGPVGAQRPKPVPHRRRRADEAGGPPTDPGTADTAEHPAHRAGHRRAVPTTTAAAPAVPPRPPAPQPDTAGQSRLSDILAESTPPTGRRRRRYREDDETDDVLSRVLRGE